MKRRRSICVAGLLLLCAAVAFAGPNFSGEWKMNATKSDFGQMPPPTSVVQKITHEDPSLKVVSTWTGDQGEMTNNSPTPQTVKSAPTSRPWGK